MSGRAHLTEARSRVNRYTVSVALALSSFVFLSVVPFLPGMPEFAILIAVAIGIASLRSQAIAAGMLLAVVSLAVGYQLISFGLANFALTGQTAHLELGLLGLLALIDIIFAVRQPASVALSVLAVALMLTPAYYLSIGVLVIAIGIGGMRAVGAVSASFVATLLPFVVLENAIATSRGIVNASTGPIIFTQFSLLESSFAPSLQQLNVVAQHPPATSVGSILPAYLSGGTAIDLLIPMMVVAVILGATVAMAGMASSLLERLDWRWRYGLSSRTTAPLVAAFGMSAGFAVLIAGIAPATTMEAFLATDSPSAGQALAHDPYAPALLILGAMVLGLALSLREAGIQRLERVELTRKELRSLVERTYDMMGKAKDVIQAIQNGAPTVATRDLARRINEQESALSDISTGLGSADYLSLSAWVDAVKARILPDVEGTPDTLRLRIVDGLKKYESLGSAYDNLLENAGLHERFGIPHVDEKIDYLQAIERYREVTARIQASVRKMFEDYRIATGAFNAIMNRELISPPIDPESLIENREFLSSMKLVTEEYWLNFENTYADDLRSKVEAVDAELRELRSVVDGRMAQEVQRTLTSLAEPRPQNSPAILGSLTELVATLKEKLDATETELVRLGELVDALSAKARKMVHFEMLSLRGLVEELRSDAGGLGPNLEGVADYTKRLTRATRRLEEMKRSDFRSILMLVHYGDAKDYIETRLAETKALRIADLPFSGPAALLYARLLADSTRSIRYDDLNEEVVARNA